MDICTEEHDLLLTEHEVQGYMQISPAEVFGIKYKVSFSHLLS